MVDMPLNQTNSSNPIQLYQYRKLQTPAKLSCKLDVTNPNSDHHRGSILVLFPTGNNRTSTPVL